MTMTLNGNSSTLGVQEDVHVPDRLYSRVVVTDDHVTLGITRPGMHTLHFTEIKGTLHWDERAYPLRKLRHRYGLGWRGQIDEVKAGEEVVFDKREGQVVSRTLSPMTTVECNRLPMEEAVPVFREAVLQATHEMLQTLGNDPKILCFLSGGADSTLNAWALRECGVDFTTTCVGVTEDYFDPKFARQYAEAMGLDYRFTQIHPEGPALGKMVREAVVAIENCEMSNTLMAICTTHAKAWAVAEGFDTLWTGYNADGVMGFSPQTQGLFKRQLDPDGDIDQQWCDYRAGLYQHRIPNDAQVAKVCRYGGKTQWRSVFAHPDVFKMLWSMTSEVVPIELKKPLLYSILDPALGEGVGAWHTRSKVGYYTGSGIGKIRNDVRHLGQPYFQNVYRMMNNLMI